LRRTGIASTALFAVLLLTFLGYWMGKATTSAKAEAPGQSSSAAAATSSNSSLMPVAPPGTAIYSAKRGESIPIIARHHLSKTSYLTSAELAAAIRSANNKGSANSVKAGDAIIIPGILDTPIVEKPVPVRSDFEVRALYLTGVMAGSDHGLRIIRRWRELGGNAVVFDIKDSDGILNIPFEHPLAMQKRRPVIPDLPKFVHFLHAQNMHAIARIAIFRDEHLVLTHPELAVQSRRTGQPWKENGKLVWTDPSQPKVQEFDIALAKSVAQSGADEVQFDYVRFPAEGDQKDASFVYQKEHPAWHRTDVITDFLKKAYAEVHSHTGQDIPNMARYCDVLSPMIYPSHFFGMDGYAHPGDAPEHFIGESMERFHLITKDTGVVLRPWLQAFAWRTKTYSPKYIQVQVEASNKKGGIGFLFWNANNNYTKPYEAMPAMRAAKLIRGDEVAGSTPTPVSGGVKLVSAPAR
jgi:hypothetical protein